MQVLNTYGSIGCKHWQGPKDTFDDVCDKAATPFVQRPICAVQSSTPPVLSQASDGRLASPDNPPAKGGRPGSSAGGAEVSVAAAAEREQCVTGAGKTERTHPAGDEVAGSRAASKRGTNIAGVDTADGRRQGAPRGSLDNSVALLATAASASAPLAAGTAGGSVPSNANQSGASWSPLLGLGATLGGSVGALPKQHNVAALPLPCSSTAHAAAASAFCCGEAVPTQLATAAPRAPSAVPARLPQAFGSSSWAGSSSFTPPSDMVSQENRAANVRVPISGTLAAGAKRSLDTCTALAELSPTKRVAAAPAALAALMFAPETPSPSPASPPADSTL
jgi:hypothetical protein